MLSRSEFFHVNPFNSYRIETQLLIHDEVILCDNTTGLIFGSALKTRLVTVDDFHAEIVYSFFRWR